MGYFVGLTDTGFVGTGEMSAVTSYMPCHIFGDQMLIGAGIRGGFYLLYGAAIIAVLFGIDKQFRFWHGAWGILALSLFISMFVNLATYNLLIIDYAILIELVLWYPVYFVFTVLFRPAYVVHHTRNSVSDAEVRERLQGLREEAVSDLEVARACAYRDVLRAFALHAAAEEAEDEHEVAQAALGQAAQHYVSQWHERVEITDGPHRRHEEFEADGGAVTTVYNRQLLDEIAAAPTRADVDKLRDLYIAAMMNSQVSLAEAQAAEQEVALIAAEELRIKRRARRPKHAARHFLVGTSIKDRLAAALGLFIWSAWMFGTAALYWPLLNHGRKVGVCDDAPTVYFVLAPKKPFIDSHFRTFLYVWTVGVCIVAVFTTALAFYILIVSLLGFRAVAWTAGRRKRDGKESVEAGQSGNVQDLRSSPEYSCRARVQHSQEILASLHHSETRAIHHRYRSRTTSPIHFSMWNIPWTVILAVLLVESIATSEATVQHQGTHNNVPLDWARPPLHETAEILAFLIGLYALVLTLLSLVGALFSTILSNRRHKHNKHHVMREKSKGYR